jgi:hypothetical protein
MVPTRVSVSRWAPTRVAIGCATIAQTSCQQITITLQQVFAVTRVVVVSVTHTQEQRTPAVPSDLTVNSRNQNHEFGQ